MDRNFVDLEQSGEQGEHSGERRETDEFKDQTVEMYNSWKNEHNCIEVLKIPGKNHYSVLDAVVETGSSLQSAIFHLMNIEERQI